MNFRGIDTGLIPRVRKENEKERLAIVKATLDKLDPEQLTAIILVRVVGLCLVIITGLIALCNVGVNRAPKQLANWMVVQDKKINNQNARIDTVLDKINSILEKQLIASQPIQGEFIPLPKK